MKWLEELLSFQLRDSGDIIHFTQDEHGKILVIDDGEYRVLNFDSPFEQSCMSTRYPFQLVHQYTQYMLLVLGFIIEPQEIALLGLGGGSLLRTLHHLLPQCYFNVVELRQKVVDVAAEYFHIPVSDRVNITVDNALNSITHWQCNSVDLIFSDMYDAYHMVGAQVQQRFLDQCSRVLTSRGWLVINLHSLPKDREAFFDMLKGIFPTVYITANTANTILFASNAPSDLAHLNPRSIENMERVLGQNFKQLVSRVLQMNRAYSS